MKMAALWKLLRHGLAKKPQNVRFYATKSEIPFVNNYSKICAYVLGGGVAVYAVYKYKITPTVVIAHQGKLEDELAKTVKLTSRERHFIRLASTEYDGQLYMTPQDFLESVIEQEPRPRMKRKVLTTKDIDIIKEATPTLNQGSPRLFSNLRGNGIISYSEYLFLLSILTKPQSGFRIAFNLFDTDGNERVDKTKFSLLRKILVGKKNDRMPVNMETIYSHARKGDRSITMENISPEMTRSIVEDTTLTIHFFGPSGQDELRYEGFHHFMLHLQMEVLELVFNEFSQGSPTISEVDFAKILLGYVNLDADEYDIYLDRLLGRIKDTIGINFEEFHVFCQFLNNLEDFSIALRMYTLADLPISKDEFNRAVKICTGTSLSPHLLHTVFAIFDDDGDGLLSYREFIAIMKDWIHRVFKSHSKNKGWKAFKMCVKEENKPRT